MKLSPIGTRIYNTAVAADVPSTVAALIVAQSMHETNDYSSHVFKRNNNAFGYKYVKGAKYQLAAGVISPEGDSYASYARVEDSTLEIVAWWGRRMKEHGFTWADISTSGAYVARLKLYSYFGDKMENYLAGVNKFSADINPQT